MKETIKTYLQKYYQFDQLLGNGPKTDGTGVFNSQKVSATKRAVMSVLRISPWLCGIGFATTFSLSVLYSSFSLSESSVGFWQWYGSNLAWFKILYNVTISGLIGFGTNWLAIRMLFRPIEKRPVWGQGLIPAQKDTIILSLAAGMHKHILSQELIRKRVEDTGLVKKVNDLVMDGTSGLIQDNDLREEIKTAVYDGMVNYAGREDVQQEIKTIIDSRLEENVDKGLKKFLLQTYKRLNKEDYEEMMESIITEIPKVTLEVMNRLEKELDQFAGYITEQKSFTEQQVMDIFVDLLNRIDITGLLVKQMEHFDERRLERMVWEATNEQLLYIQYLGTVLGILGGFLIWDERMGLVYIAVFGLLWLLDNGLTKLRKNRNIAPQQTTQTDSIRQE